MKNAVIVIFIVVLAQGVPLDVFARQPEVQTGDRVRVTSAELEKNQMVGTVVELTQDKLVLNRVGESTPTELPLESVSKLEISLGSSRTSRMWKGAALGLLAGGVAGVIIFTDEHEEDDNSVEAFGKFFVAVGKSTVIAIPCILAGGLIGSATGGERWQVVEPGVDLELGIMPGQGGGLAVAVSISF